jgi:PKD repeat protein
VTWPITPAGGSIAEDPREPYYSGGITLDHEDPGTVYLSRSVDGAYEIETWTTPDGGQTWTSEAVTAGSGTKNVRPVSPRGMLPFSGDMSVLWMRGRYPYYLTYQTSITTILRTGGNAPPVADATSSRRTGLAPQQIEFDGRLSHDPDGSVVEYRWDFGDGEQATGAQAQHTYRDGGRYFPSLTVTDDAGARDTYVTEVVIEPPRAPAAVTGPALDLAGGTAVLHGAVTPQNQPTTFHFEYGTDALDRRTPEQALTTGGTEAVDVQTAVSGLTPGAGYRFRLVATNATGTTAGPVRTFTAGAPPGPGDYREVLLGTPGLVSYWRLGEPSGLVAADERAANPGSYTATGVMLGQPGALPGDPDTSASFDGTTGEMSASTPELATSGTLEGWFHWQAGVAIMRDHSSMAGTGWILAYDSGGRIACRAGGTALVSTKPVADVRDGWHHFALTRDGDDVRLYLDGTRLEIPATAPGSAVSVAPWHVMRNGSSASQYTRGRADEVAVYDRALTAADIRQRAQYRGGGQALPPG